MSSRLRIRKKSTRIETQDTSTAPAQGMFQSRPFVVQTHSAEKSQQQPDLKTALMRAQRYGHHLGRMQPAGLKAPTAVQPKLGMRHSVESHKAKAPQMLQAKLSVGAPGDMYEQEADAVAAQVVDRINGSGERSPAQQPAGESAQSQPIQQRKKKKFSQPLGLNIQPLVQRESAGSVQDAKPHLERSIEQKRGAGQPLSGNIRKPMEKAFGADFSGVKVHADAQSDQFNQSIQAKAFTTGQDIFFRQGTYEPMNRGGQELIAHELTHVVQQNGSAVQRYEDKTKSIEPIQKVRGLAIQQNPDSEVAENQADSNEKTPAQKWKDKKPGNEFEDIDSLIRVNKIIDVADGYLESLNTKDEIGEFLEATRSSNENKATEEQKRYLKSLGSSKGGRLRFRKDIGPTEAQDSTLEEFIKTTISTVYSDGLPNFITNIDHLGRKRLYDLANAGRKQEENLKAIGWAKTQNPQSVGELVNFTEYYMASLEERERKIREGANDRYEKEKEGIKLEPQKVEAEALRLANQAALKEIRAEYNPLIGVVQKPDKAEKEDWVKLKDLTGSEYSKDFIMENKRTVMQDVKNAIKQKEQQAATAKPTEEHMEEAKQIVQEGKEKELKEKIDKEEFEKAEAQEVNFGAGLGEQLTDERKQATESGFAGNSPKIEGFWELDDPNKINRIKAAASSSNVPFLSDHAAAYHALKHYEDLKFTEERVENTGKTKLVAYLESATKTVRNPSEQVQQQDDQFHGRPAFFFMREVNADPNIVGAKNRRMRAIVVVSKAGELGIATYFKAK